MQVVAGTRLGRFGEFISVASPVLLPSLGASQTVSVDITPGMR